MKNQRFLLFILTIFLVYNPTIMAADILSFGSLAFNIGVSNSPRLTAPNNPISLGSGNSIYTLHDQYIDESSMHGLSLGIRLPFYETKWNTFGLRINTDLFSKAGLSALSAGIYTSKSFGPFTPSAYIAGTRYKHTGNSGNIFYIGTSLPVLTWGLDLQYKVSSRFSVEAAYQNTAIGYIYTHNYAFYNSPFKMKDIAPEYADPVYTIHPNSSFYVGVNYALPSFKEQAQKKEEQRNIIVQAALNEDIPKQYFNFAQAFALYIIEHWGNNALQNAAVTWVSSTQTLCYQIKTPIIFWFSMGDRTQPYINAVANIYTNRLKSNIFTPLIKNISNQAKIHSAPPNIKVVAQFLVINNTDTTVSTLRNTSISNTVKINEIALYTHSNIDMDILRNNGALASKLAISTSESIISDRFLAEAKPDSIPEVYQLFTQLLIPDLKIPRKNIIQSNIDCDFAAADTMRINFKTKYNYNGSLSSGAIDTNAIGAAFKSDFIDNVVTRINQLAKAHFAPFNIHLFINVDIYDQANQVIRCISESDITVDYSPVNCAKLTSYTFTLEGQ